MTLSEYETRELAAALDPADEPTIITRTPEEEEGEAIWADCTLALAAIEKATRDQQYGIRTGKLYTPEGLRAYADRVRNSLQAIEGVAAALETADV